MPLMLVSFTIYICAYILWSCLCVVVENTCLTSRFPFPIHFMGALNIMSSSQPAPEWVLILVFYFFFAALVLRSPQDTMHMCQNLKLNLLSFAKNWCVTIFFLHTPALPLPRLAAYPPFSILLLLITWPVCFSLSYYLLYAGDGLG